MQKENIQEQIEKLEQEMQNPDFWNDKVRAQNILKELAELKDKKEGLEKYDKGNAIVTIISGAGGDDAEDFSAMLLDMYLKYANKKNWEIFFIHENKNEHNGYRNVSFEVVGSSPCLWHPSPFNNGEGKGERLGPYGVLKNESGVHRLVRISPFNAKKLRHRGNHK